MHHWGVEVSVHARTLTHTYNLSGLPLGRDEDELKCLTDIKNFTNFIVK